MTDFIRRLRQFILHDVWTSELSSLTGIKAVIRRLIRICELVIRGFRDDHLTVQASALTFATLISLVPVLAIALSLLKGLGGGEDFINRVHSNIQEMPLEFRSFIDQILEIVNRTNFWALGWVAVGVLFLTVIQVLSNVEASFNKVWGVNSSRALLRRFVNYISIIVVVPLLIMLAFTMNASMSSETVINKLGDAAFIYRAILRLLPFFSTAAAIFLLFVCVPNTSIRLRPALISSIITALLWLGWQDMYVSLQVGVARSNAIYGTFASVPIFLMWLYVSWVIILFGAELCFALQNHVTYDLERSAGQANDRAKVMLAISIALQAGRSFLRGDSLFNAAEFARVHRIPVRLINELIRILVRGGLMVETAEHEQCYVLRRPLEEITLKHIVDLVHQDGTGPERYGFGADAPAVQAAMSNLDQCMDDALSATTIKQLLDQHPVPSEPS